MRAWEIHQIFKTYCKSDSTSCKRSLMAERLRDSSQSWDSVDASFPSDKDITTKAVCLFRVQETRECYDGTVSSVTYVMIRSSIRENHRIIDTT